MVGWHHQLNGHGFEETPGDDEGQGSLECCSPWGRKETQLGNWTITTKAHQETTWGQTKAVQTLHIHWSLATWTTAVKLLPKSCQVQTHSFPGHEPIVSPSDGKAGKLLPPTSPKLFPRLSSVPVPRGWGFGVCVSKQSRRQKREKIPKAPEHMSDWMDFFTSQYWKRSVFIPIVKKGNAKTTAQLHPSHK